MLTKSIRLKNFQNFKNIKNIKNKLKIILSENTEVFKSLSKNYKDKYNIMKIKKIIKKNDIRLIGMGGSILGSQAIYNFLKDKIKINFTFEDNLNSLKKDNKKNYLI